MPNCVDDPSTPSVFTSDEHSSGDLSDPAIENLAKCMERLAVTPEAGYVREDTPDQKGSEDNSETRESGSSSTATSGENGDAALAKVSDEDIDFEVPSAELEEKIVAQVESYFTDFNVMKDNFLLKHIRRNKEGYISLKLVSSFRKVKTLTKDWRVVRHCLRNSKALEVNAEGTKVRRIQPIPPFEETSCAKMVLVFNIPTEDVTAEAVSELLRKHGEVVDVTVIEPGSKIPDVCTKRCLSVNGDLVKKTFALVEFKTYDSAQKAIAGEGGGSSEIPTETLKVAPLLSDVYKNKGKSASDSRATKLKANRDDNRSNRRRRSAPNRFQSRPDQLKTSDWQTSSQNRATAKSTNKSLTKGQPSKSAKITASHRHQQSCSDQGNAQNGPSVSRVNGKQNRERANGEFSLNSWLNKPQVPFKGSMSQCNNHHLPENVIRWPRGPDGTTGFHQPRGYPLGYPGAIQPVFPLSKFAHALARRGHPEAMGIPNNKYWPMNSLLYAYKYF